MCASAAPGESSAGDGVAVIGASFAGLFAAAAAAKAGRHVTILERDRLPAERAPRSGVAQSEQPHVLLHRGLLAIESLLPGLREDLLDHGGVPFNTGQMPWLGEYGWMPLHSLSFELISLSRPLLELLVRRRVIALEGVTLHDRTRVTSIRRAANDGWQLICQDGSVVTARIVLEASGRSSRLAVWLGDLGIKTPEPVVLDAKVGYACRPYRGASPVTTGIVIAATPQTRTGALAVPVEENGWLVAAAGYGDLRPGREVADFEAFLKALPDPALTDLISTLDPIGRVAVHRQTGNRRFSYGRSRDWPVGLLVVGDALCAFNPVYGQGITVAAGQAEIISTELATVNDARSTRRLQRRLAAVADTAWSVATSQDRRMPTSSAHPTTFERLTGHWAARTARLAAAGDEACIRAFARIYHLMGSPLLLFHPGVDVAVLRSLVFGVPPAAPRPPVLETITAVRPGP